MTPPDSHSRQAQLRAAIKRKQAQLRSSGTTIPARPADAPALLDPLQQGIWLAHTLNPDAPTYNQAIACRVHGDVDPDTLDQAFQRLVACHRLLRSTFHAQGEGVLQRIHETNPVGLERIHVEAGEIPAKLEQLGQRPFDLQQLPLLRLSLLEDSEGARWLLFVVHHLIADERALSGLWQDLATAFERSDAPQPPARQFDDWSYWQRTAGKDRYKASEAFWREELTTAPPALRLPFQYASSRGAARGRLIERTAAPSLAQALRDFARTAEITPFVLGAFTYRLLLQRASGSREFAFSTPTSVRFEPVLADMLGAFINPLIIRTEIDENDTVRDALSQYDRTLRQLQRHAAVPFQSIVDRLGTDRTDGKTALLQAMFVHQTLEPLPTLGTARLQQIPLDLGAAKYDLTLFLLDDPGQAEQPLRLALEYRADRYPRWAMEWLLKAFEQLLESVINGQTQQVSDLSWLDVTELKMLDGFAQGVELAPSEIPMASTRAGDLARVQPNEVLAWCGEESVDYARAINQAHRIAMALRTMEITAGDRVALFLPRTTWLIPAILAIHMCRAAYVPLDPSYPRQRNQAVLSNARAKAVVTTQHLTALIPDYSAGIVRVDQLDLEKTPKDLSEPRPDDMAYLLYTSGSTGTPKGVMVSHANLQASTLARLQVYGMSPPRYLLLPSVAFDSSVAGLFGTLAAGGTLVIPTDEEATDPRQLAQLIQTRSVTHLLCVPSLYASLIDTDPKLAARLSVVIVAGESCPAALVQKHFELAPETRLFNEYGPTEGTVWASVQEFHAETASDAVSIGRPIPGVRIDLLDPAGRPVPPGVPGQAYLSGPTVTSGYWQQPELTAERFPIFTHSSGAQGTRYATGDLMSWDPGGTLYFHGRVDEQIKLRGFRIEPDEIVSALTGLPAIQEAVVLARPLGDAESGAQNVLVAFVRASEDEESAWRDTLSQQLPGHMVPARIIALTTLPRLPNGKVNRRKLEQLAIATPAGHAAVSAALSTEQLALKAIWGDLLGTPDIGLDDNFFTLGGHSLLAVQLALAIEKEFGQQIAPAEVFAHPSIRSLSAHLERDRSQDAVPFEHLFPLQPGGSGDPLIVAIPHFFADLFAQRFRGERPVYALRGIGLRPEGNLGRWPTMEALGKASLAEIDRRFPDRNFLLAGYSFGASLAWELATQMEARGRPARQLILIAPMPFDLASLGPVSLQLDNLQQPAHELTRGAALRCWLRANHPFGRGLYRRVWHRLVISNWRRFLYFIGKLKRRAGLPLSEQILWADVRVERFHMHSSYQPKALTTPTVVLNPEEPGTDAAATWKHLFSGPLELVATPDPHGGDAAVAIARERLLTVLEHTPRT